VEQDAVQRSELRLRIRVLKRRACSLWAGFVRVGHRGGNPVAIGDIQELEDVAADRLVRVREPAR